MGATMVVVGHPINIAGVWSYATHFAASDVYYVATSMPIPVASLSGGQAEASLLLGQGNATIIG